MKTIDCNFSNSNKTIQNVTSLMGFASEKIQSKQSNKALQDSIAQKLHFFDNNMNLLVREDGECYQVDELHGIDSIDVITCHLAQNGFIGQSDQVAMLV